MGDGKLPVATAQDVIDGLAEHVVVLDAQGVIRTVNAAWVRFGAANGLRDPHSGVGTDYLSVCTDPQVREGLRDVLLRRRRSSFSVEYPCHSPTEERWFVMWATPLADAPGAVISHLDITTRRQHEAATEVSRAHLAAEYGVVFNASRDGLIIASAESGAVLQANPAFVRLSGGDVPPILEAVFAAGTGVRAVIERQLAEPNASPACLTLCSGVVVEVLVSPIEVADHRWVLLTLRDVSPRLAMERERARLVESALVAQKLEAVGQLAAGMAHDMNNTLAILSGAVAELSVGAPVSAELLSDLSAGIARGGDLMNSLLALGRKTPASVSTFDVGALLAGCARMLQRVLPPSIRVATRVEGGPLFVQGDFSQWHQAVINLAVNARDALPRGGQLELSARSDGAQLVLSVSDDGVGMSDETRARALEPFFTTKGTQGTGLGLAHVQAVASAHGADVELVSELGRGTTVCVRLLLAAPPALSSTPASGPSLRGHVLVVDDEVALQRSLGRVLRLLSLSCHAVGDGRRALAVLEAGPLPDFLLTDLAMPEMNGLELVREVRRRWPSLPVLVSSGFVDEGVRQHLSGLNAPILNKPFNPHELAAALERARAQVRGS